MVAALWGPLKVGRCLHLFVYICLLILYIPLISTKPLPISDKVLIFILGIALHIVCPIVSDRQTNTSRLIGIVKVSSTHDLFPSLIITYPSLNIVTNLKYSTNAYIRDGITYP